MNSRIRPGPRDRLDASNPTPVETVAAEPFGPLPTRPSARDARFTREQVIAALRATGGINAAAAKMLGCSRQTVGNYIERDPVVREAATEIREALIDRAEAVVLAHLAKGSLTAAALILRTLGRGRGWNERIEVSAPVREPQLSHDWSSVPTERLRELRRALASAGVYDRGAEDDPA